MTATIRQAVIICAALVFFGCVAWQIWIHVSYGARMPASPQLAEGRIYRIVVNHGTTVYVNEEEFKRANFAFNQMLIIEGCAFAVGFLIKARYGKN